MAIGGAARRVTSRGTRRDPAADYDVLVRSVNRYRYVVLGPPILLGDPVPLAVVAGFRFRPPLRARDGMGAAGRPTAQAPRRRPDEAQHEELEAPSGVIVLGTRRNRTSADIPIASGNRPVMLVTFDVPFKPKATELAIDAAVESGQRLIIVNAAEVPLGPISLAMKYEYIGTQEVEDALQAPPPWPFRSLSRSSVCASAARDRSTRCSSSSPSAHLACSSSAPAARDSSGAPTQS